MTFESSNGGAVGLPQSDGAVRASGGEGVAVWAKGDCPDPIGMTSESSHEGAVGLPQADGAVIASGGEGVAVGAKGDRQDYI